MGIVVARRRESVESLVSRSLGKEKTVDRARVVAAARAGNPGLDLAHLQPGDAIVMPKLPSRVTMSDDVLAAALDEAESELAAELDDLIQSVQAASVRVRTRIDESATLANAPTLRRAATKDQKLRNRLTILKRDARAASTSAQQSGTELDRTVEIWKKQLQLLRELAG